MEDWMKGVKQFQAQVEEAKTLKVSLRYHQTIFRYMLKLRQHRPRIATQLERKWKTSTSRAGCPSARRSGS